MGKYKNLLVNIGLFTLNTVSTKLITFLLVPLYTYFLTTAQYGVTDMSLTVAGLITPVLTLSIGDATTRYIIDDPNDKKQYISVGFWVTLFGCLLMLLLLPLLNLPIFCLVRIQRIFGECGSWLKPDKAHHLGIHCIVPCIRIFGWLAYRIAWLEG